MRRIAINSFLAVVLLASIATFAQAQDLTTTANRLSAKHARGFLTKHSKVQVEDDTFKGSIEATNLNRLKTKLWDIKVSGQTAKFKADINLPLTVKGKVKFAEEFREVDAQLDAKAKVEGSVELKQASGRIFFVPKCKLKELKCEITELVKPLRGAGAISKIVNGELEHYQPEIQLALSKFLEKQRPGIAISTLKQTLEKELKAALSKYSSKAKPLAKHSHRKTIKKWKVKIGTEKVDATIWLKDPNRNLRVSISKLKLANGRIVFEASASAAVAGRARAGISKVTKSTNAKGKVSVRVAGSAAISDQGLSHAKISRLDANVDSVSFSNDLVNLFKGTIRKKANNSINKAESGWKTSLEKKINGLKI